MRTSECVRCEDFPCMDVNTGAHIIPDIDVAIRAVNAIAKRRGEARVVPAGATYKIRGGDYRFHGIPAFPSYLQAGPSFFVEKSKRKMIAEDIGAALRLLN